MRQIDTLKNLAGRRLFLSADTPAQSKIADRLGLDIRIVSQAMNGEDANTWHLTKHERYRDNMTITFSLSKWGLLKDNSGPDATSTLFRVLRSAHEGGIEATPLCEALLARGVTWSRKRALQELARHVKSGLVVKSKVSGAINF